MRGIKIIRKDRGQQPVLPGILIEIEKALGMIALIQFDVKPVTVPFFNVSVRGLCA